MGSARLQQLLCQSCKSQRFTLIEERRLVAEAVSIAARRCRRGESLPDTAERGILGAVYSMVGRQVMAGRSEDLTSLLPDLTQFVLTPYLGAAEARRVAAD